MPRLTALAKTDVSSSLHHPHLDRVDDLLAFAYQNGADDDDGGAFVQSALFHQTFQAGFDGVLRVDHVERHDERRDAPTQCEAAGDFIEGAHRIHWRVTRAQPARVAGHVAVPRENQDGLGFQFVGHDDRALDEFLARGGHHGVFKKIRAAAALDAERDAVENLDATQGMLADGGFAAEHDGIRLLINRVGDIRDFGARGHGRFNHAFQHVRRDDDRFALAQAGFDDAALDDGQFLVRNFDPQIAARDHYRIGFAHDVLEIRDGLLVLDFGDDERLFLGIAEQFSELEQIAGFAYERQRDEIHLQFEPELSVRNILRGEGGQAHFDAGQIDVTPAAELAFGEDFALDLVAGLGEHFHFNGAVVDEHNVANVDVINEFGVVDIHGALF